MSIENVEQTLARRWPTDPFEKGLAMIAVGRLMKRQFESGTPEKRYRALRGGRNLHYLKMVLRPIAPAIGIGLTLLLLVYAYRAHPPRIEHPVEVPGTVIGISDRNYYDEELPEYVLIVQYEANGRTLEIQSSRARFTRPRELVGTEVTVRYEETDPDTAYIIGDLGNDRDVLYLLLAVIVLFGSLIRFGVLWKQRRRINNMITEGTTLVSRASSDLRLSTVLSFAPEHHDPLVLLVVPRMIDEPPVYPRSNAAASAIPVNGPIPIDVFIPIRPFTLPGLNAGLPVGSFGNPASAAGSDHSVLGGYGTKQSRTPGHSLPAEPSQTRPSPGPPTINRPKAGRPSSSENDPTSWPDPTNGWGNG